MNRVKEVDGDEIKCGIGGNFGNKGAVLARMKIDSSSICFVSCHLESGNKKNKERIMQFNDIHNKAF